MHKCHESFYSNLEYIIQSVLDYIRAICQRYASHSYPFITLLHFNDVNMKSAYNLKVNSTKEWKKNGNNNNNESELINLIQSKDDWLVENHTNEHVEKPLMPWNS